MILSQDKNGDTLIEIQIEGGPTAVFRAGLSGVEFLGKNPPISRGLGDTIAKATKAVGIKPCGGCKKRQAALNKLVPYKNKP